MLALADARARVYQPSPLGLEAARAAVAADYAGRGIVPSDRIVLTASTSEAYALLFKLLCDPGDEVLVPQPSYPLFELLTRLEASRRGRTGSTYHGAWSIDRASARARADAAHARGARRQSPNNPTGSMLRAAIATGSSIAAPRADWR